MFEDAYQEVSEDDKNVFRVQPIIAKNNEECIDRLRK